MQKHLKKYSGILLAVVLVFGCFSSVLMAYADDLISINSMNFPNANWREAVKEYYDTDGDGFLSLKERSTSSMSIPGVIEAVFEDEITITDITGIEYFSSLKILRCGGIGLTKLDVSNLTYLETLTCQGNELTSLTVRNNAYLKELNCSDNELTELSLTYNVSLQRLLCEANKIETLNMSALDKLNYLKCSDNELKALDLSANKILATLICSGNHIPTLDLSANTALQSTTSYAVGAQTVTATAVQRDSTFYVPFALTSARVVATSMDLYENGEFSTADYSKLTDGFTYDYDTGNANVGAMDVSVATQKSFYMVRFYTNENKGTLLSSCIIVQGEAATAPTITQMPQCKEFDSWSEDISAVMTDMDVYVLYKNTHGAETVIALSQDGTVTIACSDCGATRTVQFISVTGSAEGDANYDSVIDVNNDGYINVRDYSILYKLYC